VRPAFAEGVHAGVDDVRWGVEIRLTDFQMNDALALAFQCTRFVQNFKGSLGS
jgi:hypothetical protein